MGRREISINGGGRRPGMGFIQIGIKVTMAQTYYLLFMFQGKILEFKYLRNSCRHEVYDLDKRTDRRR